MFKKYHEVRNYPITIGMYTKLCVVCTAIYAVCFSIYCFIAFADEIGEFFQRKISKIKGFFSRFRRSATKG